MVSSKFSEENIENMSPELLRAVIRERAHHTLEHAVYRALTGEMDVPENIGKSVEELLDVWKERGLSTKKEDFRWVKKLLRAARRLAKGKKEANLEIGELTPLSPEDRQVIKDAIQDRRSIRHWVDKEIPDQFIGEIIQAGLWAPHSCNLQTIRVIIIKGQEASQIFNRGEVSDIQVMLAICQDKRPYEFYPKQVPDYNRGYDCGAAIQNMLLMAHSLGIGSVWLTYQSGKETIRELYNLPDYIQISSFIALGWPKYKPLAPGRMDVGDVCIDDSTFDK